MPKKSGFNFIKKIFLAGAIMLLAGFIVLVVTLIFLLEDIPDPNTIVSRQISESTKIYDRTENSILYDIHGEEKRTIISWERIPESVKKATLASEDSSFYSHQGVDFKGISRAFLKNIKELQISQGGSTITQQLVKKALLGDERTVIRKLKELVLTLEIERRFSKDQIFWMYLNQIPYGSNSYGIEAASQTFFGISAEQATIAQAAVLASLPKAPTFYSPYGNNYDQLVIRQKNVLMRMKDLGYITNEEYEQAKTEKLNFKKIVQDIRAPHFVIMVREYLINRYGEEMVENGGLKVVTTLDTRLQETGDALVSKYSQINEEKFKAANAALVAVDPRTGHILAMVGSRDYFDIEKQGNFNVALARRQPGSAFKPFAYATALKKGFPDSTVVFDLKTEFNPQCQPDANEEKDKFGLECYHPKNYDELYRGPVTMRQALAQSLNLPSVKFLYLAGINETIQLAQDLGISTLQERERFGLSLVLGGAEVKLLDITSAYGVFANDGIRNPASFIIGINDAQGNILEEYVQKEERVLESQIARMVTDMLSDNTARTPVFGPNSHLFITGRPIAAKTGTTQDNRDGWLIGYTPSVAVGVWTGNNDNSSMTKQGAGVSAAGPLWNEFMRETLKDAVVEEFIKPDPMISEKIALNGNFESPPNTHSILFYVDPENPADSYPSNPYNNPQFLNWEYPIQKIYNGIDIFAKPLLP